MKVAQAASKAAIIGAVGFFVLLAISIWAYPGYSFSENYLSDLGVHQNAGLWFFAALFWVSTSLWFVALVAHHAKILPSEVSAALFVAGIGLDGVALFPASVEPFHTIAAGVAFLAAGGAGLFLARHWFAESRGRAMAAAVVGVVPIGFVVFLQDNPLAQKVAVGVMLAGLWGLGFWFMKDGTDSGKIGKDAKTDFRKK